MTLNFNIPLAKMTAIESSVPLTIKTSGEQKTNDASQDLIHSWDFLWEMSTHHNIL